MKKLALIACGLLGLLVPASGYWQRLTGRVVPGRGR